ncbi:DUF6090 family protein [Flagellimonas okinawensis]|uniref:DUF6090 family protein n=1 Tax=Flagellimonas okinawensis TaxID=3031324 RepID=A0ABT5XJH1_9FLAO|nr:DUF6090 family protein [[Muricauda] okinawensis]MDF0706038.1 DUF6090 family protein [[Muricauda] okinawensis]
MIRFFRKIRQRWLNENKFTKYLLYAIGEIFLVVIGILLALQINNWNDRRKEKQKETFILKDLHQEFASNKKLLDSIITYHKQTFKSAEYLKSQLPIDVNSIDNLDSLSYHLFTVSFAYTYNPSTGIINSLLNNSSIEIISNDELRQLLIGWKDVLSDYQEEELRASENYLNHLKPFEKENFKYSLDYKELLSDPRIDLTFLETLAFDNYVLDRHNDLNNIVNSSTGTGELNLIMKTMDRIIQLSDTESKD